MGRIWDRIFFYYSFWERIVGIVSTACLLAGISLWFLGSSHAGHPLSVVEYEALFFKAWTWVIRGWHGQ